MRTFLLIVGGLVMLGGSLLAVRCFGASWRIADVGERFIPIWFCLSASNLWIGVTRAGYSIDEELPIFMLTFTIPASMAALLWWRSSR
jgi:hypothetical protein